MNRTGEDDSTNSSEDNVKRATERYERFLEQQRNVEQKPQRFMAQRKFAQGAPLPQPMAGTSNTYTRVANYREPINKQKLWFGPGSTSRPENYREQTTHKPRLWMGSRQSILLESCLDPITKQPKVWTGPLPKTEDFLTRLCHNDGGRHPFESEIRPSPSSSEAHSPQKIRRGVSQYPSPSEMRHLSSANINIKPVSSTNIRPVSSTNAKPVSSENVRPTRSRRSENTTIPQSGRGKPSCNKPSRVSNLKKSITLKKKSVTNSSIKKETTLPQNISGIKQFILKKCTRSSGNRSDLNETLIYRTRSGVIRCMKVSKKLNNLSKKKIVKPSTATELKNQVIMKTRNNGNVLEKKYATRKSSVCLQAHQIKAKVYKGHIKKAIINKIMDKKRNAIMEDNAANKISQVKTRSQGDVKSPEKTNKILKGKDSVQTKRITRSNSLPMIKHVKKKKPNEVSKDTVKKHTDPVSPVQNNSGPSTHDVIPTKKAKISSAKKTGMAADTCTNTSIVNETEISQNKTQLGKRKRATTNGTSTPQTVLIASGSTPAKRQLRSGIDSGALADKGRGRGICTRTRSGVLKPTATETNDAVISNIDDFTGSDEEPLVSKISDTLNSKNQNHTPAPNEGEIAPNNTKLSILIDNETRELADRHSKAAYTADSIDSSFNVNNGGIHTRTSSSSADESANVTVQPETEPPIENLLCVMKRGDHHDNDKANNAEKEDDTLQQSLESYLKNNSDADRTKKFLKTKEYIDKWILDIARLSSSSLFLRWLVSVSPDYLNALKERFPFLTEDMLHITDDDYDISSYEFEEMTRIVMQKKQEEIENLKKMQEIQSKQIEIERVSNENNAEENKTEYIQLENDSAKIDPTLHELAPVVVQSTESEHSALKVVPKDQPAVGVDIVNQPETLEKPAMNLPTDKSTEDKLANGGQEYLGTQNKEGKVQTDVQSQVVSADHSHDVYDFDSESELSAHNTLDEFSWKPKRLKCTQRPHRPIPSYTAVRKIKSKQSNDTAPIANFSFKSADGNTSESTPGPSVNNFVENSQVVDQKNNTDGQMFLIPLEGINKDGDVNNMIGGVAVKVNEKADKRVILSAKLVTKSVIAASKNATESLSNQVGPAREVVNSVLPAGSSYNVTPVNLSVPEPSKPIPVVDEMAYMHRALDSLISREGGSPGIRMSSDNQHMNDVAQRNNNCRLNDEMYNFDDLMINAPLFSPSESEFQDPMEYIEKITPIASKYGICKIVPPASFQSECNVWEDMRFTPYNQYVHRMLHRWGPSSRQMCAIKKYLATQGVTFSQPPKLSGIEVDLPKLYHVVQSLGGLKRVLEKKMWMRVAEEMSIPFNAHYMDFRLDEIYCKYLLPYDTLSNEERQKLFESVDKQWEQRHEKLIARAANPMNCPDEEDDDGRDAVVDVTEDIEECVTRGKSTTLGSFARLAKNIISMHFGKTAEPTPDQVEKKFWEYVTNRKSHICVNSGSIDSSVWGYGFPSAKSKGNNISKHPWNLKILTNNNGSVLRSLGPMVGVTAPTLHVGMAFSACCWYRDPHGLPWIEYLHQGAPKVWYGVPATHAQKFRDALSSIVPGLCQQKTIWLLSDTAMVPPSLLTSNGVSLCRTLQQPGEFVIVFPKAFSSNICTGYSVSESVYFALHTWLQTAQQDFTDIRNSCEPSMFSLERLMVAISEDQRSSYQVLKQVLPALNKITQQEKQHREILFNLGLKTSERAQLTLTGKKKVAKRQDEAEECQRCRTNLALSMLYHTAENASYCLIHGAEYLERNRDQVDKCKLIFMHSIEELQTIMSKLIQRINNLANKKTGKGKNL